MNNRWYYHEIFKTSRKFYHEIFILEQNLRNHKSFCHESLELYSTVLSTYKDFDGILNSCTLGVKMQGQLSEALG